MGLDKLTWACSNNDLDKLNNFVLYLSMKCLSITQNNKCQLNPTTFQRCYKQYQMLSNVKKIIKSKVLYYKYVIRNYYRTTEQKRGNPENTGTGRVFMPSYPFPHNFTVLNIFHMSLFNTLFNTSYLYSFTILLLYYMYFPITLYLKWSSPFLYYSL